VKQSVANPQPPKEDVRALRGALSPPSPPLSSRDVLPAARHPRPVESGASRHISLTPPVPLPFAMVRTSGRPPKMASPQNVAPLMRRAETRQVQAVLPTTPQFAKCTLQPAAAPPTAGTFGPTPPVSSSHTEGTARSLSAMRRSISMPTPPSYHRSTSAPRLQPQNHCAPGAVKKSAQWPFAASPPPGVLPRVQRESPIRQGEHGRGPLFLGTAAPLAGVPGFALASPPPPSSATGGVERTLRRWLDTIPIGNGADRGWDNAQVAEIARFAEEEQLQHCSAEEIYRRYVEHQVGASSSDEET